jgi:hypothetical protein
MEEEKKTEEKKPWHRQPGESEKAHFLFGIYADLHHRRSYSQVAKITGYSPRTIMRIAKNWDWKHRAFLLDRQSYMELYHDTASNIADLNYRKINQKISLSASFQDGLDQLQNYLTYFDKLYNLPESKEKVDFLRKVTRLLAYMLKMQDLSVSGIIKDVQGYKLDIVKVFRDRLSTEWTPSMTPQDIMEKLNPPEQSAVPYDNKLNVDELNKIIYDEDGTKNDHEPDINMTTGDKT